MHKHTVKAACVAAAALTVLTGCGAGSAVMPNAAPTAGAAVPTTAAPTTAAPTAPATAAPQQISGVRYYRPAPGGKK